MSDRRTARTTRLLDPVWHQLRDALDKLYAEVEPGAYAGAITVMVANLDGMRVAYTIEFTQPETVQRHIVTDERALLAAVDEGIVDASLPDGPE
jgi:hypothetical protein